MLTRLRVVAGALALAAPAVAAAAAGSTTAQADTAPAPTLRLSMPTSQTVYSYGPRLDGDLGLRLVATDAPLELRVKRADYDSPLQAYQRIGGTDVALPGDLPVTFDKLKNFLLVTFTPLGTTPGTPYRKNLGACVGQQSDRIDPAAPADSDYPTQCFYSAYALGALMGVQQGYAASVMDPWGGPGLRVGKGRYRVTVAIRTKWADALHVPAADRSVTGTVTVKKEADGCISVKRQVHRGCRVAPRDSATARHRGARPVAARAVTAADLPADTPLPDLRALPATGFAISRNGNYLQFSATVWNSGTSPMVVDGFRDGPDTMDGYQYFYGPDGKQLPDYAHVGSFEWDPRPTHMHWHFKAFAAYSMLPLGQVPQPSGHAHDVGGVDSRKEAFCLANTDAVDLTGPGAMMNPDNTDLATACGDHTSLSTREVLAAGWGDTYAQFRAGQSFDLRRLKNGCFNIWVEGNPVVDPATGARTLIESDTSNNQAKRKICIGGTAGHRTIRSVQKVGLVDDPGYADMGPVED